MKAVMVKSNSNLTIYARFFVVFTLLIAIPCFVLLEYYHLNTLSEREQAVQTSVDAQSLSSQQQGNLQRMNALLQARFNQIFASLSDTIRDPALANAGGLVSADIVARDADFAQGLADFQSNYDLTNSSNMTTIRSILINDNPTTGPAIIADQQQALNEVLTTQWPAYEQLQKQDVVLLDSLDPTLQGHSVKLSPANLNAAFTHTYNVLWHSSQAFTDLQISWQRVVDDTAAMGKTVAAVGSSQTLPVYISIIFTCTILLIFAIVRGFTSFQPKRLFPLYRKGKNSGNTPVPPSGSIPPVPQLP